MEVELICYMPVLMSIVWGICSSGQCGIVLGVSY